MHFLRKNENPGWGARHTTRVLAAVRVRHETVDREDRLVLDPDPEADPFSFVKPGTALVKLPDRVPVLAPDGSRIKTSHQFWVTTETFNPYHLVLDIQDP